MSSNSLVELMEKAKSDYYQTHSKNTFFKNSQKLNCAKKLTETFDIEQMIQQTIFRVGNTNKVLFNYSVFKLYAHPNNYERIIEAVIRIYNSILEEYQNFEAHVILEGFTISAAERYKEAIQLFCHKCMRSDTKYSVLTKAMYIYYTPSMIENISMLLRPFIEPTVHDRIVMFSKEESARRLQELS